MTQTNDAKKRDHFLCPCCDEVLVTRQQVADIVEDAIANFDAWEGWSMAAGRATDRIKAVIEAERTA
jgi:hypothetical protein